MMDDNKVKILLCEDDENLGMLLREYLQAKGFVAELCSDGEAGFKANGLPHARWPTPTR